MMALTLENFWKIQIYKQALIDFGDTQDAEYFVKESTFYCFNENYCVVVDETSCCWEYKIVNNKILITEIPFWLFGE